MTTVDPVQSGVFAGVGRSTQVFPHSPPGLGLREETLELGPFAMVPYLTANGSALPVTARGGSDHRTTTKRNPWQMMAVIGPGEGYG